MVSRKNIILLAVIFAARGVFMVTVVLSPPEVDVIENSNVTLTCKVMNSPVEVYETSWSKTHTGAASSKIFLYPNGTCSASGALNNGYLFAWTCERNSTFTLTIKGVKRNEHMEAWLCDGSFQSSNASRILVRVPVGYVEMKSHTQEKISIQENISTTFECNTTSSRPIPAIFWFLSNPDPQEIINVTNEARQSPQAGESINFAAVTSVLNYSFSRKFNGWSLYCQATNMPAQYVTSGEKQLDIMYPPDGNPKLIGTENDSTYRSVEHQLGRLTCIINGGNPLPNLTWLCFEGNLSEFSGNDRVSSNITWTVLRKQHNKSCTCVSEHTFGKLNVSTVVKVLYSPDKPNITIHTKSVDTAIEIIENNSLDVTCISKSNPESDYTWIRRASILETGQSMRINSVQEKDIGKYTCMVNNTMIGSDRLVQEGRNSANITLHLLFPPRLPVFHYIDKKTDNRINETSIDVIKGDIFTLRCQSEGRPSPGYRWENGIIGNTSVIVAKQSLNETCTATNNMTETVGESRIGSAFATISVTVLYSPTIPQMFIYNHTKIKHKVQEHVGVIENYSFNLTCISDSRPNPQYKWYVNHSEISSQQELVKMNISRQQKGIYKCQASNTMIKTFGERQHGTSNVNAIIDVLYPAEVGNLTETVAIEGSSINMTCPIIPGNPLETTVKWKPGGDLGGSTSHTLYIANISRKDEDIYVCSVTTIMEQTYGPPKEHVNDGEFLLTVVYKARVTKFYIGMETDNNIFTVNEMEDVTFLCYIDSKPSPNATIHNDVETVHVSGNNNLVYTRKNIQCTDYGLYICSGINYFNYGTQSEKNLTLYVNCSPRPSPFVELSKEVRCARNMPATLSFTALAYPEPGQSGFSWNYLNGSDMISLSNNSNTVISSSSVQSNLTIKNVTQEDYGHYILKIMNRIDVYEQPFVIEPYDVPMPPVILTWTASNTDITITIKAGSDGGLTQLFHLRYTEATEENWIRESIKTLSDVFNHTVSGLSSGKTYRVIVYATNKLGNSTEETILVETKEHMEISSQVENSSKTGLIAGTVSGAAMLIIVSTVVGIFLYRKRTVNDTGKLIYQNVPLPGKKLKKRNETLKATDTPMEDLQEIDDAPVLTQEPTEYYNSAERLEMIDIIKVSELFSYLLANDADTFGIAYQKLPTGLEKPCIFAKKPENIALNRYNGIYPYDHSRVKLRDDPDFFINACYIDGYQRPKSYIASLGPTGKTTRGFETFWQMIWHEKSDIIVMLTNLREPSGMKCEQYWPKENASELYGDVCVSSQKTEVFAEYTVRTLTISKDEDRRTVTHLHYTSWPDKKVPEDATSLLEFRQRMKSTPTSSDGPVIVHCSAGIGRTGTLIALDRLIEEGNCEGSVNVFACVNSMREQRVKMVQTLEQYIYIYKALVNAFSFDSETIPVESFQEYVDTTNNNVYSRQFQQLKQSLEIEGKEDLEPSASHEKITKKNRMEADIPARRFCVLLYTNEADEDSEYINAVYMNSFRIKEYFIIAQSPLPNTVADFICMMYQEDCTCIVTMEDLTEPGMTVGIYLPPDKQTLKFGNFTASCTILETKHHCIIRKVKLKKNGSGEKSLYHFQYTKWITGHDTPVNAREFVQFVIEVEEYARQFCEERSHVLVHCLKANERSGLFCAMTTLLEKLKYERQVNVLNTLRHLRTRRRSAITSMEQLKFCYHAASVYIKMYKP